MGLGAGVLAHILVDMALWFDGVEILWPLPSWINFWEGIAPPEWWSKLMLSSQFLFFAMFFALLGKMAAKHGVDEERLPRLRMWIAIQTALFVIFTLLVYMMEHGVMILFGAVWLLSLALAFRVIIRMRKTIEFVAG